MSLSKANLVWVDLEMTTLDIEKGRIIEMACIITDSELNIIEQGPNLVIHHSEEDIDNMSEWSKEHHGLSGLTEKVRKSNISNDQAEQIMLEFIQKHTKKGLSPLCGNSIHCDKQFLDRYMPKFSGYLHYRIIDVSSIKELCRRWYPDIFARAPPKKGAHRALDDILESIKELKYYRQHIFKQVYEKYNGQ